MKTDNKLLTQLSPVLISLGLAILAAASVYSIMVDRPLFWEGAPWVFRILEYKRTSLGYNQLRYLTALFELPALLVSFLWSKKEITFLTLKIWECCLVSVPYLGLAGAYGLLRKYKKREMYLIVLMCFATVTSISFVYTAGQMAEIEALFWPLLILVWYSEFNTTWEAVLATVLIVGLSISHEAAVLFLAFLFGLTFLKKGIRFQKPLRILLILGITSCLVREQVGYYPTTKYFLLGMEEISPLLIFPLSLVFIVVISSLTMKRRPPSPALEIGAIFAAMAILLWNWSQLTGVAKVRYFVGARSLGATLTLAMAVLLLFTDRVQILWGRTSFRFLFSILTLAALVRAAHIDFLLSRQWHQGVAILDSIERQQGPGCRLIPVKDFVPRLASLGLSGFYLPEMEILLQKNKNVSYIAFLDSPELYKGSPCDDLSLDRVPIRTVNGGSYFEFPKGGYFQLDDLKQNVNAKF